MSRTRSLVALLGLVAFLLPAFVWGAPPAVTERTALDDYVAKPDPTFTWRLAQTKEGKDHTVFAIELISQTWRNADEVDRPVWKHWLMVVRPKVVKSTTAFLFIGGGSHRDNPPDKIEGRVAQIAAGTSTIVAELHNIPNQPLVFKDGGRPMVEDDLIAFTWDKFMKTKDPEWPARLPMVKSAVRAMDALQAFTASKEGGGQKVESFMVSGGSKRGWTTWCTAAVDPRVIAISPLVIDTLNVPVCSRNQLESYGFWSPSVGDYIRHNLPARENTPEYADLLKIEDPYSYRERFTMPKFVINAAGDQYFPPDSSRFYYHDLPGEKLLRYVPNADHSLRDSDAVESLVSFYDTVLRGLKRPAYSWKFQEDGSIRVETKDRLHGVKLWQANNPKARDFRLEEIGKAYVSTDLTAVEPGVYVGKIAPPEKGFTAFFVELACDVGSRYPLKVTTDVRILPDRLPFKGMDARDAKIGEVKGEAKGK